MEVQFPFNFPILVIFSSFIFLLIKEWKKTNSLKKYKNLPPSPSKLPVIGHLHHLIGQLPHQAFRKLEQKYGPVVHLQLGEIPVVVIASREAAKQVVKDQDPACADRPSNIGLQIMWYNYVDMAFSPYNEYWRQMRKICILELLSAKNVKSFGTIRQDEVAHLIKYIQVSSGESINLSGKLFTLTSSIISRAVFGKVMKDQDTLISLVKKGIAMSSGFDNLADLFPSYKLFQLLNWNKYKLLRMRHKLDSILDAILEDHKLRQGGEFGNENIIDVMLRIQKNKELEFPIGNNNIKAIIYDMFTGAIETSSSVIDWAMVELMRNPHIMAKLQQEIREAFEGIGKVEESELHKLKYLNLVIKETIRLHPPIPLLPRACKHECKVDGYTIYEKSKVMVNIWSMGRNPQYWHDPERFHPERLEHNSMDYLGNNFEFLPFGAGRRVCPGINFGLANIDFPLAKLLFHFNWEMPKGMTTNDIDMTEVFGIAMSRKNSLFLVPTKHLKELGKWKSELHRLKYLKLVIKETLRLHPPIPFLPRACKHECKSRLIFNWSIGRNPQYWHDPERFHTERLEHNSTKFLGNNFEFHPFGAGRRICPGINFGLANIDLPLAKLLFHFNWNMPKGMTTNDIDMTETFEIAMARENSLFLVPTVKIPSFEY
ncbi:hypothetical protein ACJIZ3_011051 [Penstemon smallii]|uniref:Cytochrome P450 n=1 Tax=Penstemon smallii TaxID=265156 RepID=A0ABD3UI19_9LAMI